MLIHIVDTNFNRGVVDVVLSERFVNSLVSYAYKEAVANHLKWPKLWGGFADLHDREGDAHTDWRSRVIIDSGAFTAFTSGISITPQEYGEWALGIDKLWRSRMASLVFMNLDVIGDQDASWVNQAMLEKMGIRPLPIITYGAEKHHLVRALDEYDYIALGGLVPYTRQQPLLQKWLDYCFSIAMPYFRRSGVMPKIHLLGVTTEWVHQRYPAYSCDSSSWKSCYRFPGKGAPGIKNLPKPGLSDGAHAANLHTIRFELQSLKRQQQSVTKLWASRGIQWND